ncbi:MAG: sensor histidine kinase [Janthinobacterium lividum]
MRSIRQRLFVGLGAGLAAGTVLASWLVFTQALRQADDLFDLELHSVALSLPRSVRNWPDRPPPPNLVKLATDRLKIQVWNAAGQRTFANSIYYVLPRVQVGYGEIDAYGQRWRTFGLADGRRFIQVAQPVSVRNQLAVRLALRTVLPLLVLFPFMALLAWLLLRRELAPVDALAAALRMRSPHSLAPLLPPAPPPRELAPLWIAVNELMDALQRALAVQKNFVADAAHGLRSPLTALKLQIDLSAEDLAGAGARADEAFTKLRERVDRIIRLVHQLLTLAGEEARRGVSNTHADLAAIAREVVSDFHVAAARAGMDVGLIWDGRALPVQGDEGALRILLHNLVDNAVRYARTPGAVDIELLVEAEPRTGAAGVVVQVSDAGPGIGAADEARIFDRFYRGASPASDGSGLGLSIVSQIAQAHGATVSLLRRAEPARFVVRVAWLTPADEPCVGSPVDAPRPIDKTP